MDRMDRFDDKLDKVATSVGNIDKQLEIYITKNEDSHVSFDKRINCLEQDQTVSKKAWADFLSSPLLIKALIIIVFLIVVGGSGITIAELIGFL